MQFGTRNLNLDFSTLCNDNENKGSISIWGTRNLKKSCIIWRSCILILHSNQICRFFFLFVHFLLRWMFTSLTACPEKYFKELIAYLMWICSKNYFEIWSEKAVDVKSLSEIPKRKTKPHVIILWVNIWDLIHVGI